MITRAVAACPARAFAVIALALAVVLGAHAMAFLALAVLTLIGGALVVLASGIAGVIAESGWRIQPRRRVFA